jgi:hypothetical protein
VAANSDSHAFLLAPAVGQAPAVRQTLLRSHESWDPELIVANSKDPPTVVLPLTGLCKHWIDAG